MVIVICLIFDICYLEFNLQRNLYGVKLEPGPLGLDTLFGVGSGYSKIVFGADGRTAVDGRI